MDGSTRMTFLAVFSCYPLCLTRREAMIKVSVMYPNKPGVRFDHDYYRDKHLPLIKSRMGAALQYYAVDKELTAAADAPAAYVAMCHLLCDSVEAYQSAFGPYAKETPGTSATSPTRRPFKQISEVVIENSATDETEALHRVPMERSSASYRSNQVTPMKKLLAVLSSFSMPVQALCKHMNLSCHTCIRTELSG
jgi:uncharacterized protein (TIGR02118 family)